MDSSTLSTDTAHLRIFIRGTGENFTIIEELAGQCSLKGGSTRIEIADEALKFAAEKLGLAFDS